MSTNPRKTKLKSLWHPKLASLWSHEDLQVLMLAGALVMQSMKVVVLLGGGETLGGRTGRRKEVPGACLGRGYFVPGSPMHCLLSVIKWAALLPPHPPGHVTLPQHSQHHAAVGWILCKEPMYTFLSELTWLRDSCYSNGKLTVRSVSVCILRWKVCLDVPPILEADFSGVGDRAWLVQYLPCMWPWVPSVAS